MKKYIFVFILIVLYFGGLNSVRELGDLAIVKAVSIDKNENGEYEICAIVIDTKEKENKDKGIIIKSVGKSVHEAARNMVDISSKKLYIAHMETLIVSDKIARYDLENTLDFFIRDNEGSNSFFLFINLYSDIIIKGEVYETKNYKCDCCINNCYIRNS